MLTILIAFHLSLLPSVAQERLLTVRSSVDGTSHLFYTDEIDSIDFRDGMMTVHPKSGGRQSFVMRYVPWMRFSDDAHEAVDLGLSVKWATCNVGADTPQQYGSLFAWGEVTTKSSYTESSYKYFSNYDYEYIGTNICGTDYDAARRNWGGKWRLPTRSEARELMSQCTWTPDELDGVAGYRVTGPSGRSIFLPATGYRTGTDTAEQGTGGYYWTGSLYTQVTSSAYNINFQGYDQEWTANRAYGFAIRPVR